ncbi:MAG: hypothetical protein IPH84_12245 [Bacteroidales bacterium]|nr:hypothetical protein [Bacteroidales bacterium]
MRKFIPLIFILFLALNVTFGQSNRPFCNAVQHGNYRKVERILKHETRKYRHGVTYDNGPGSGMQVTHSPGLDSLTSWFKTMPCVKDAYWDKCCNKPGIYPGWAVIGVLFDQDGQTIAKCFTFQLGTTGSMNVFGWRPHILPMKDHLIYRKISDCPGFIERERRKCEDRIK